MSFDYTQAEDLRLGIPKENTSTVRLTHASRAFGRRKNFVRVEVWDADSDYTITNVGSVDQMKELIDALIFMKRMMENYNDETT